MNISQNQKYLIMGTLLGDGCLERNGSNPRLRLEHTNSQRDYLEWKVSKLKNLITPASPMKIDAYHKIHNRRYLSWRAYTFSIGELEGLWNLFYRDGKKVVSPKLLKILDQPLSLAVWFMDDGYKRNDCNAFRLSTDGFKKAEIKILCKAITTNFNIDCTIHKKGKYWNIYIPQRSAKRFVRIVRPHIIPSMRYKITLAP